MFQQLLPMMVLSIGGALAIGTIMAFLRPRAQQVEGELERPPLLRSLMQVGIGLLASAWAVASLLQ